MKKILCGLLLSISLWGCSSQKNGQIPERIRKLKNLTVIPADAKPAYQISLKKEGIYSKY